MLLEPILHRLARLPHVDVPEPGVVEFGSVELNDIDAEVLVMSEHRVAVSAKLLRNVPAALFASTARRACHPESREHADRAIPPDDGVVEIVRDVPPHTAATACPCSGLLAL